MTSPEAREAWGRLTTLPFSTVFACFAIFAGLVGLIDFDGTTADALGQALGRWGNLFELVYLVSGAGMLYGLAFGKAKVESPALVLLGMNVVVRSVALVLVLGFGSRIATGLVLNALVIWACWVRVAILMRGDRIVRIHGGRGGRSE